LEELQGVSGLRALRVKVKFLPVGEEVPELPVEAKELPVGGKEEIFG
jgi:hypothetical protein